MVEVRDDGRLLATIQLSDPDACIRTTVPLKRYEAAGASAVSTCGFARRPAVCARRDDGRGRGAVIISRSPGRSG